MHAADKLPLVINIYILFACKERLFVARSRQIRVYVSPTLDYIYYVFLARRKEGIYSFINMFGACKINSPPSGQDHLLMLDGKLMKQAQLKFHTRNVEVLHHRFMNVYTAGY